MEIEELKEELKKYLKEERYKHSIGVMDISKKLAQKYGVDEGKIAKAALMHDMAKELPIYEIKKYIKDKHIYTTKIEMLVGVTLHGKVAADMCKRKYGFDEEMCKAISNHTTGRPNMSMFEKIIFIADKIDETRSYEGVENLRNLAFENIDKAIVKNIDSTILLNLERGRIILEESIKTRNFILKNCEN